MHDDERAAGVVKELIEVAGGYESIMMTETYAHLMPDQQRAAADAAGRAMTGLVMRPRV